MTVQHTFRICFIMLLCFSEILDCYAKGGQSSFKSFNYKSSGSKATLSAANNRSKKSGGGLGISAWGLIAIIMTIIIVGAVSYYSFLLYPMVCTQRGRYDVMEMSHV